MKRVKVTLVAIDRKIKEIPIILRYLFAGGSAAVVQLSTLYVFTDRLHVWYVLSSTAGFCVAVVVSFTLQKFLTFQKKDLVSIKKEFPIFLTVALANAGLNAAGMYIVVDIFGLWYLFAQIVVAIILAVESFFVYRHVIFV